MGIKCTQNGIWEIGIKKQKQQKQQNQIELVIKV